MMRRLTSLGCALIVRGDQEVSDRWHSTPMRFPDSLDDFFEAVIESMFEQALGSKNMVFEDVKAIYDIRAHGFVSCTLCKISNEAIAIMNIGGLLVRELCEKSSIPGFDKRSGKINNPMRS